MEKIVAKYDKKERKRPHYLVFDRKTDVIPLDYKGIFGKLKASVRIVYLARSLFSDSAESEVAKCVTVIEEAIATEAKICNLSAVSDPAAWDEEAWNLIDWLGHTK